METKVESSLAIAQANLRYGPMLSDRYILQVFMHVYHNTQIRAHFKVESSLDIVRS